MTIVADDRRLPHGRRSTIGMSPTPDDRLVADDPLSRVSPAGKLDTRFADARRSAFLLPVLRYLSL
jgi:hypothetical protein